MRDTGEVSASKAGAGAVGAGSQQRRVARPPGPGGPATLRALLGGVPATDLFADVARRYPRLAHTRLGREHLYFVNHPALVRQLFVTQGRWTMKGRALQRSKQLLGEGLLTSEGEMWRRQRRLVQPAFHGGAVARYAEEMLRCTDELVARRWRDGVQVAVNEEMSALTLSIVGRSLFGTDLSQDAPQVSAALATMVSQFQRRVLPGSELLDLLPLPSNRRGLRAVQSLDRLVVRIVQEHRVARPGQDAGRGDLLSELIATGMDDRQLRDEIMTLLLAGHETTANALTWSWVLLSGDPAVRDRLHTEVDATLPTPGADPAAVQTAPHADRYTDLYTALPWTRAVVAESLRLYPPAWSLGRRVVADVILDGWTVPAGSLAVASQWVLHRDPRFWTDPGTFRPDRWLDGDGRFDEGAPGQPRGSWFPFGLGQRVCVGEPFAWMEAVLVLAWLSRRWHVEVSATFVPRVEPAVTLRPHDPVRAVLRRR